MHAVHIRFHVNVFLGNVSGGERDVTARSFVMSTMCNFTQDYRTGSKRKTTCSLLFTCSSRTQLNAITHISFDVWCVVAD